MREQWGKLLVYFDRPVPARPLCLFRVFLGLLLFWETATLLPHSEELFSSEGLHSGYLELLAPPPATAKWLCLTIMAGACLLVIGLLVKPALLVTSVIWFYLFSIDQISEKSASTLMYMVLLLLLFLPCGRFYSIDAWLLARWKPEHKTPKESMPGLMFRLLQILYLQAYFFSGFNKLLEVTWRNGSALADSWSGDYSTNLALWLAGWMPLIGYKIMSLGVIGFELLAPWGLNSHRWLSWFFLAGLAIHMGIQLTLNIGALGYHFMLAIVFLFAIPGGLIYPEHFLKKSN